MALLNSHTVINTLLIAGAAFLALMAVAVVVGVARWVA